MADNRVDDWEDVEPIDDWEDVRDIGPLEAGLAGAARSASFEFADEIFGGVKAPIEYIKEYFADKDPEFKKLYQQERDRARKYFEEAQRQEPVASTVGELGGAFVMPIPGMGLGKAAITGSKAVKGLKGMERLAEAGKAAKEIGKEAVKASAIGGAEGAAVGLGASEDASISGDLQRLQEGFETGAMVGGAMPIAGRTLKKSADLAPWAGKKAGRILGGVSEETQEKYMKGRDRINKAEDLEAVGVDVREGLERVKKEVSEDSARALEVLDKQDVVVNRDDIAANLEELMQSLRVGDEAPVSQEQMVRYKKLLDEATDLTDLPEDVIANIEQLISGAKGAEPVTEQGIKVYKRLQSILKRVENLPEELPGSTVKRIIQEIDPQLNFNQAAGEFNALDQKYLKQFRKFLSEGLKDASPEYKKAMEKLSKKTGTLEKASKAFGKENTTASKIKSIARGLRPGDRKALEQLGEYAGQDYMQAIDDVLVKEAFEKTHQMGSRNVNLFGILAGAVSASMGDVSGLLGAGAGAALGATADKYGPAMTKRVIDIIMDAKANPKYQTFINMLTKAAEGGNDRLMVTHQLLSREPDYQEFISGATDE